ncbi:MAG: hypothetical protein F4Z38_10075 [Chloroflexi bacterium]|nr:hypothetical protein [Chloroflexota bacterium]
MSLTIEVLPDPAANDLRLTQLAAERSSPLDRLNILHGSALKRLSTQRMLAEANGGAVAAVYGWTPVDLAQAAAQLGDPPERQAWPPGADLATLRRVLRSLPLSRLDGSAPGVASALLRTLTDLREAALSPDELPDGDLKTIFSAWVETVSTCADRTSHYEDAVSPATSDAAFREALGGAPLIISGVYDLTRIQRLLLRRLSGVVDVRMLLVAPSEDPASPPRRTVTALQRDVNARTIGSDVAAAPLAPDFYFSVGDPTAEADEIAARILRLGREGVAFNRIAVLHQQGAPADDRICAALERAEVPTWRIGGRALDQTPLGHAVLSLIQLLLDPDAVERSALLDLLSHRALHERPLGVVRRAARWEQQALDAGLTTGLHEMRQRLDAWSESAESEAAKDLTAVVTDLSARSRALEESDSWTSGAALLQQAFEAYFDARLAEEALWVAVLDTIEQMGSIDALGDAWTPSAALTMLRRAFGSRVVRDPRRLIGGVNVGAVSGPARGICYEAVFVAGVAERVFPAVGRQDPLLTDDERAAINDRVPQALALQRDRADSDRHAWALARRAAGREFTASWSRRSSAVGGPARPSSLILESVAVEQSESTESTPIDRGRIERISTSFTASTSDSAEVEAEDWSDALDAPDQRSFELALLGATDVDTSAVIPQIWPEAESVSLARRRRNAATFTEFDGLIDAATLSDDWKPLDRSWSAAALETYVTCPYRFFLRHVIGARGEPVEQRPDRGQRRAQGRLIRRILSSWVREYERFKEDHTWFEYVDIPTHMNNVARRMLDPAEGSGLLGPPTAVTVNRRQLLRDLDRARRREATEARNGWRPLEVNVAVREAPIRVAGARTLHLHGLIDRIDQHANGRQRAITHVTGASLPDVRGFVNGSSLLSVASLAGLTQRGVPIVESEVEHRSITEHGKFESQLLTGESLTSRGSRSAPSDGERLRDTLATIADQLESANFTPYPGHPARNRPNCASCPYESSCTADVGRRYEHKARQDQDVIRDLESLRRRRL